MTDPPAPRTVPPPSLAALRRGDAAALTTVYEAHGASLLRTLAALVGDRGEAEDLLHDLFIGLPEAVARYEERGQFGAWLRRVAVRLALTRLRTRKRRREVDMDAASGVARRADGDGIPDRLTVQAALDALPEGMRTVVILREYEGWPHRDIAAHLGISEGAVMTRHCRAMQRLRLALTEDR